jgi:hypothetical protein
VKPIKPKGNVKPAGGGVETLLTGDVENPLTVPAVVPTEITGIQPVPDWVEVVVAVNVLAAV